MNPVEVFGLQIVLSLVVFSLLARWQLAPRLARLTPNEALFWLTVPHAFRHIGLVFLVPGVVAQPLPEYFALPAAYGDLAAGLLALTTLIALRSGWTAALPIALLFNVVGTVDLINALRHAEVVPYLGAAWYIPTFFVPLLLVTHYMSFVRLLPRPSLTAATQ
jgi:hypothetical protein